MKRKALMSGKFYPSDEVELKKYLSENIKLVKNNGKIRGVLAPHAGYVYSGHIAAAAFSKLIGRDFSKVFIIGSGHTEYMEKCVLIDKLEYFQTPLKDIKIDLEISNKLAENKDLFKKADFIHNLDHSIEVQLPFIQFLTEKDFEIIPILANTRNLKLLKKAADTIADQLKKDENAVFVVSSDLSHYPPAKIAELSDRALMESFEMAIANKDADFFALADEILTEKFSDFMDTAACGFAPMYMSAAIAVNLGLGFKNIKYANSSSVSGDNRSVVGYAAGVFAEVENPGKIELSKQEQKELLTYARNTLENFFLKQKNKEQPQNHKFYIPAAVFVTLHKKGNLRGCIGCLSAHLTLIDAIEKYALSAAFEDNRFSPLKQEELKDIEIEISILSPLKKIDSHQEIEINKHGVYVKTGNRSGTYLPQVWEHFKNKEDFMDSLCYEKAGLPKKYWKEKSAELYVYSADLFKD